MVDKGYNKLCIHTGDPLSGKDFTVCCFDRETCGKIVELVHGYQYIDKYLLGNYLHRGSQL